MIFEWSSCRIHVRNAAMYVVDATTVSLDDAGGTRPIAGYFAGTNEDGTVDVVVGDARFKFRNEVSPEFPAIPDSVFTRALPAARPWQTKDSRAKELADRCQTLEDEKRGLEVENSRLRREVDRLGRKR